MKKNWKEYSPDDSSWEGIMKKKDFDSQLDSNLKELPKHSPSAFAWDRIEKELDKEKKAFAWRPLLIAASLAGLILLAFYQIRQGSAIIDSQAPTEILAEEIDSPSSTEIVPNMEQTESNELDPVEEEPAEIEREYFESFEGPERSLALETTMEVSTMDLTPRGKFIPAEEVERQTYHTVAVSWGLKEKGRLRFGSKPQETTENGRGLTARVENETNKKPLTIIIK